MRLSATRDHHRRQLLVHRTGGGAAPLSALSPALLDDQVSLLSQLTDGARRDALQRAADDLDDGMVVEAPETGETAGEPVVAVDHVLGIGLNYRAHAADLGAPEPQEPAWFTKFARTIGASGSTVFLPPDSQKVTAEAELGLVIGQACWRVSPAEALDVVAGAVTVLDHCAEDILHRNTRFLTRSKNFPTFLTVGSDLVTLDELLEHGSLGHLEVTTTNSDGSSHHGPVADMLFDPARIISELSAVVPLRPGDLITTGTPGATRLHDGDRVTGEVTGVGRVLAVVSRPDGDTYRAEVLAALPHLDTRPV